MRLKIMRLGCKLLSAIYHQSKKRGLGVIESIAAYWIEELCNKHNNLVDRKRRKIKTSLEAIHKYPYITTWQYIWDLDKEGKNHGKIYTDTSMDLEE